MNKKSVYTKEAPEAIGPYSQAVVVNGVVYTSGQLGLDPNTVEMADGVVNQTHQVLKNVQAVLKEAGSDLNEVVKATIFLNDMNDFSQVNEVYASYFEKPYPSRSAIEVSRLPKDALVEVEVIALEKDNQ
ncbi:RidA family protein [Texcoconibacillus texcoconensis]|uniref:2-iminobutanoate/2-iminopropanoate deaminase n=1 Tax=Texcoconibacillus texcoconensis TaxID=1095777 RepID=A0A840QQS3_9BACI|nr:RidA family protein [Texcoconibacillus texcoconensis]MBB5173724.1 2-iminobutanoate/2-iminopropanoate deaminase [Texcoconibacillus texcoconensis]